MANPLYPSLIPRYVDESWFAGDQPVDENAKLNELEIHDVWIRESQYRSVDVHTPHIDPIDDNANDDEDEDEDEVNDDDEEDDDDDDMDDNEDMGYYAEGDSPNI